MHRLEIIKGFIIIVLTQILFFLPAFLLWEDIFSDDCAFDYFPKHIAIARILQKGEIPLWNGNTFCGAKPFFNMYEMAGFNPIFYPLYLLSDTEDLLSCFYFLRLIPLFIVLFLAAFGGFLFGRLVAGIEFIPAIFMGLSYSLSPTLTIYSLGEDFGLCCMIPWVLLGIVRFIQTFNYGWWIVGAFLLAVMNSFGNLNNTLRSYLFMGLVSFFYVIFSANIKVNRIKTLLGVIGIFIMGSGICGIIFSGQIEGLLWMSQQKVLKLDIGDYKTITLESIITMFIPNFFGTPSENHKWGPGLDEEIEYLRGGFWIMFLLFCLLIFKDSWKKIFTRAQYEWLLIGIIGLFSSIFLMAGDKTLIYRLLKLLFPFLLKIPHPIYFHFIKSFSFSIISGICVSTLINNWGFIYGLIKNKASHYYLGFIVLLALLIMLINYKVPDLIDDVYKIDRRENPIYKYLIIQNEEGWFLLDPVAYFLICGWLLLRFCRYHQKYLKVLILFGILFDLFFFGYHYFYEISPEPTKYALAQFKLLASHHKTPVNHPLYQLIPKLKKIVKKDECRWIGSISGLDNMAMVVNGRATLGFDCKPLITEFQNLILNFTNRWPYQLEASYFPYYFLSNSNTGYLLAWDGTVYPSGPKIIYEEGRKTVRINDGIAVKLKKKNGRLWSDMHLIKLPLEPLPYIYFQDRVVLMDLAKQEKYFLYKDLRGGVLINPQDKDLVPYSFQTLFSQDSPEVLENFLELQNKNKIITIDRTKANSLIIKTLIPNPAMLVINEAWHKGWKAFVDGKKIPILKVNYFQQGIWLNEGEHTIFLIFRPMNLYIGIFISLFFVLLTLFIGGWRISKVKGQ